MGGPLTAAAGELLGTNQPGMEEVDPIPDQFLFVASARVTNVADIHATAEDLMVAGVGGEEEEAAAEEEEAADSEEPDLPDPERSADPAVVQVIVQRKKRKNGEISTRPVSKRTRRAPARLLD